MYLIKIFQKGGGMGELLKFVTLHGISEKNAKLFAFFAKMTQF